MKHRLLGLSAGTALGLTMGFAALPAIAQTGYKLVKTIDLPGTKGGHGDWTTFDPVTGTVWLSQSPDHNVVVLDASAMSVKHVIPDIKNGNGIALTPDYAFLSDNGSNDTVVVDKHSFAPVATLKPQGKGPNGTVYAGKDGGVLVTTDSDDATFFSADKPFAEQAHFQLQPYPAKDGPDVGTYVPSLGRIYQPVDNVVDLIDPASHAVVGVWKPGIKGSGKPMVYDAKTGHFLMGTTDKKLLVLDATDGKVVASIPVSGAVDETAIDEGLRRAYVGDKAGKIDVVDLDQNKIVDELPSEKNVHTLAVDSRSHRIFVYRNVSNKVDVFEPTSAQ